ncbi:MAG: hypothetical protein BWY72_01904 [Bacteroidetes bacterium ADurb.Bin416]|nr:MAG: hypothetical protein BWY72_01904 [Bacteroidetes bacterium ADurb.Bin416]
MIEGLLDGKSRVVQTDVGFDQVAQAHIVFHIGLKFVGAYVLVTDDGIQVEGRRIGGTHLCHGNTGSKGVVGITGTELDVVVGGGQVIEINLGRIVGDA